MSDKAILGQPLNDEELSETGGTAFTVNSPSDTDHNNCFYNQKRDIYGGDGFANCAATVEENSWCSSNDACFVSAVNYWHFKNCSKAYK